MRLNRVFTNLIKAFFRRLIDKNKELIMREGQFMHGFYVLLFKQINTGERWTKEDLRELRRHFWHLSGYVPVLVLFLMPGGSLVLPLLAELLDRRSVRRDGGV